MRSQRMEHEDIVWYVMEELVAMIQGGRDDLMEDLWVQLRGLVVWYARRYYTRITKFDGTTKGSVDIDDLTQSGYLALAAAVADYDASKGAFTTYLHFHIKKEFRNAVGRSDKQLRDPLNDALSLDVPVNEDDPDSLTKLDFVPDQRDDIADADDRIFLEELHNALERALDTLPMKQAQAIRSEFWDGCTLKKTAEKMGYSTTERVRQLRQAGLQRIRNSSASKSLEQFLDDRIDYYKGSGLSGNAQGRRHVECLVIRREYLRLRYERIYNSINNNQSG